MSELSMNVKSYSQILDAIGAERIPADLDLTPKILVKIQHGKGIRMQPRTKLVTIVLIVLLALLVLTTVAYAIYRLLGDPGLQSVQDAGLVTDLDVTALPTILQPVPPPAHPYLFRILH